MTKSRRYIPAQQQKATAMTFAPARGRVLQRACACGQTGGGECEECSKKKGEEILQRSAVTAEKTGSVPPIVRDVLQSPGQPLDRATREFFEPRFGQDFSGVRVHTDARAAESAQAVDALAYTVGRDVVFDSGQYVPGTSQGRQLIAHELVHIIQQTHVHQSVSMGQTTDGSEREADRVSRAAVLGQRAPKITSLDQSIVQRKVSSKEEIKWEADHPEGQVDQIFDGNLTVFILWNFPVGRSELKPEHARELTRIARIFRGNTLDFISVEGHASNSGSSTRNKLISEERARIAAAHLRRHGVSASQIAVDGLGDSDPRVPNTTAENMARNRRVEIRGALLV